jgi:hypothetical protein
MWLCSHVVVRDLQVYTAEEKAALAMYNFEENKRKEEKILADMERLVHNTLGDPAGPAEEEPVAS